MLDLDWNYGAAGVARPTFPRVAAARALWNSDPYRYLLLLRFAGYNIVAAGLFAAAAFEGWVSEIVQADSSGLVLVIAAIFAVGMVLTGYRALQLSRELNEVRSQSPDPLSRTARFLDQGTRLTADRMSSVEAALRLRIVGEIAQIRHLANSLVLLGLIGTILGFVLALGAVDPEAAGDVAAVGPMISGLIEGLGVALYTTLVGSVLNIWLMLNYRILEGGASRFVAQLIERGASNVESR